MKAVRVCVSIFCAAIVFWVGTWTGAVLQHGEDQQAIDFAVHMIRSYQQQVNSIAPCVNSELEE